MPLRTYLAMHAEYLVAVAVFLTDVYAAVFAIEAREFGGAGVFALLGVLAFFALCAFSQVGEFRMRRYEQQRREQRPEQGEI